MHVITKQLGSYDWSIMVHLGDGLEVRLSNARVVHVFREGARTSICGRADTQRTKPPGGVEAEAFCSYCLFRVREGGL